MAVVLGGPQQGGMLMIQYAAVPETNSHPLDTGAGCLAPKITIQVKRKSHAYIFTKMTQVLLSMPRNHVDATPSSDSLATQMLVVDTNDTRTAYLMKVTRE